MDALKDGMPQNSKSIELGIQDIRASKIHALGSRIPLLTKITEFYQTNTVAELIFSKAYFFYLSLKKSKVLIEFKRLANTFPLAKKWIVVSTHFALAESVSVLKKDLEKIFNIKVFLFVVMTDDSPQHVWVIKNADLIFSPSLLTKDTLLKLLGQSFEEKIKVVSFPVSPRLTKKLTKEEFQRIENQLNPLKNFSTHIEIPISGAAVQLTFFENLIRQLSGEKFEFTVVGQKSLYTDSFFKKLRLMPKVQLSIGQNARQTVDYYESLFSQKNKPSIEISKPSEQVFKAILKPTELGGVILLLTPPIGRQEHDNLKFLVRHDLLPNTELQKELETEILNFPLSTFNSAKWQYRASHWRAIRLPLDPQKAALFIQRLKEVGILFSMLSYVPEGRPELTSTGVAQIWQEIDKYLSKNLAF